MNTRLSPRAVLGLGVLLVVAACMVGSARGAYAISPQQLWQVLLDAAAGLISGPANPSPEHLVFMNIRLPRLVLGIAAGAGLGLAGALMQGLFRNPLADPGLVGISSGAALAAGAAIVLGGAWLPDLPRTLGSWTLVLMAFGGGLGVTFLIYALSQAQGGTHIGLMLLAGVAVNALAGAGLGYLNFIATDEQLRNIQFWLLGSLGGARWSAVALVGAMVLAACAAGLACARPLNALALGEAQAALLGVNVERIKRRVIVVTALAVGAFLGAVALWLVPMLLTVWSRNDPDYTAYARDILFGQTASRYLEPTHHLHPPWYYLQIIATLWLPTALALIWAIPHWWRGWRRGQRPARVWLPLSWASLIVLFFSLSGGKRDVYIMPALPMLVLALAPLLPGLLRRPVVQRTLFVIAAALALLLAAASLYAIVGTPAFAEKLRSMRGLDPWHITLTMGVLGLVASVLCRPRRGALSFAATMTGIWLLYGLWAYPLINDTRSARGVMQQAGALIGPDAELGLLSWKEQNLLMADRPATVFGFLRPQAEQELAAVEWLRAAPEKRWILAQKLSLTTCFLVENATAVGEANRRRWFLVNADALRPTCLPHPPEAWVRHKVSWN